MRAPETRCIGFLDGALYDFLPCFKGSLISFESNSEAYYILVDFILLRCHMCRIGTSAAEPCTIAIKVASMLIKVPLFDVNLLTLQ